MNGDHLLLISVTFLSFIWFRSELDSPKWFSIAFLEKKMFKTHLSKNLVQKDANRRFNGGSTRRKYHLFLHFWNNVLNIATLSFCLFIVNENEKKKTIFASICHFYRFLSLILCFIFRIFKLLQFLSFLLLLPCDIDVICHLQPLHK